MGELYGFSVQIEPFVFLSIKLVAYNGAMESDGCAACTREVGGTSRMGIKRLYVYIYLYVREPDNK